MRILGTFLLLSALTITTAITACSSSSTTSAPEGCASNPFTCGAGQTCSVKDSSGTFACIASGSGTKGSPCLNTAGMTTCGDGLTCLQVTQSGGECTSYCEVGSATHGCAAGETCAAAALAGTSTVFHVCAGGTPIMGDDAGSKDAAAE